MGNNKMLRKMQIATWAETRVAICTLETVNMFCHTEPLEKRIITTLLMRVKLLKKQQRY